MIYKDPIVILVNGNQLGKSFASALQDYNSRWMGSANPWGKATMQSILPLEPNDTEAENSVLTNFIGRREKQSVQDYSQMC
jgi:carboxyl-terminal processing protease